MTHAELIDAKGAATIAEKLGVKAGDVRVWKHRGIPRSRFGEMIDAFPDVSLETLKGGVRQASVAA